MRLKLRDPSYLPQLDGLRGSAILLVLLAHGSPTPGMPLLAPFWRLVELLRTGYVGVDLFFVLSGFLITRLLSAEKRRNGRIDLTNFYVRRTLRIFPIYYLAVFVVIAAWPTPTALAGSLVLYAFNYYLPFHGTPYPLEHTWSLAVEEQFYILWPAAVAALSLRQLRTATLIGFPLCALGVAIAFSALLEPTLAGSLIYTSLPTRMFSLLLGAWLAVREAEGAPVGVWGAGSFTVAGGGVLVATVAARAMHVLPPGGWYWCCALVGYGMLAVGIVGAAQAPNAPALLLRVLSWRPLRFVGLISYGLYLYHLPIFFFLGVNQADNGSGVPLWRMLGAYALSFLVALLSFLLIERPLLRNRARLSGLLRRSLAVERSG